MIKLSSVCLIVCCVFISDINLMVASNSLESPCPDKFYYQYDRNGMLHGIIEIYSPNDNVVQLNVELSVGNNVENYNGNIELSRPKSDVIDDVLHRRPIRYNVLFPYWINIPPKVTKILVNGNLVCSGPKLTIGGTVSALTTIHLQHTLTINVNSLSKEDLKKRMTNNYRPPQPFDHDIVRPSTNNRRPINFNPQPPNENPSKVYAMNPFLNFMPSSQQPPPPKPSAAPEIRKTPPIKTNDLSGANIFNNPFLNGQITPSSSSTTEHLPTKSRPPSSNNKDSLPLRDSSTTANSCGFPIITTQLIFSGSPVPRGSYPWLVAMFAVKNTGLEYKCSGSLISHRHVVTAAHCVRVRNRNVRPDEILLVLGKLNIKKWTSADGERTVDADSIHVHPEYETMSAHADIAVIVLVEVIEYTKFIRPICLWSGSDDLSRVVGEKGKVIGWGKNEYGEISTAEPKETTLPIVSQEQCLRSSDNFQFITSEKTFCAGFRNGSGPCNGDSGSGFIIKRDNRWFLRGIVSMSLSDVNNRTCDLSNYVVFTDASKYVDWLLSFIE